MFALKPIAPESLARALEKAERYRLLNEPHFAESICLDVLALDPNHQQALVIYLLALTDQFGENREGGVSRAQGVVAKLHGEYERCYYTGIVHERRGKARLSQGGLGSGAAAFELLHDAMHWYEKAQTMHPTGNDDAILRYNTCVRLIQDYRLEPPVHERHEYPLE
jgi:hypothetical protein